MKNWQIEKLRVRKVGLPPPVLPIALCEGRAGASPDYFFAFTATAAFEL